MSHFLTGQFWLHSLCQLNHTIELLFSFFRQEPMWCEEERRCAWLKLIWPAKESKTQENVELNSLFSGFSSIKSSPPRSLATWILFLFLSFSLWTHCKIAASALGSSATGHNRTQQQKGDFVFPLWVQAERHWERFLSHFFGHDLDHMTLPDATTGKVNRMAVIGSG